MELVVHNVFAFSENTQMSFSHFCVCEGDIGIFKIPVYRGITMVLLVKLLLPPAFKYPEKKASPNRINNQSNQKSLAESNSKWVILTSKSTYSCFAFKKIYWANIHMFKVNNRNTRKSCEICSKLTTKAPERRQ